MNLSDNSFIIPVLVGSILSWGAWITRKVYSRDSCLKRIEGKQNVTNQKLDDLKENFKDFIQEYHNS